MSDARGQALSSVAVLVMLVGGAMLLHGWDVLPAPQHLLPLLLVYIGVRGARHTERGARVVSIALAALGVFAQAAVLQDLPPSERAVLAPIGQVLDAFGTVWGVFTRGLAVALLVAGGVLLIRARRAAHREHGPFLAATMAASAAAAAARSARAAFASPVSDADGTPGDVVDHVAIFSGFDRRIASLNFRGGRLAGLFGGIELDLRSSVMARPEARLDAWCLFAGASILVPHDCEVVVKAVPIFGSVQVQDEKHPPATAPGEPPAGGRLVLGGAALFSGIEVRRARA